VLSYMLSLFTLRKAVSAKWIKTLTSQKTLGLLEIQFQHLALNSVHALNYEYIYIEKTTGSILDPRPSLSGLSKTHHQS